MTSTPGEHLAFHLPREIPRSEAFVQAYKGSPPWEIGRPQQQFVRLAESDGFEGSVLDSGCGTGEQALLAAARGHETTGVDIVPGALEVARRKATERGLEVDFVLGDVLELSCLGRHFDTVLDSGVFHVFDDEPRAAYVRSLESVTAPGARLFLLCFNDKVPGDFGPRRVSEAELRDSFSGGWRIDEIAPSMMELSFTPAGVTAWFMSATRT